jgi:hypothetical protein
MATRKDKGDAPGEMPERAVDLKPLEWVEVSIPIVGVTPLIPHKWSDKAKEMMRGKQAGKPTTKKPPKDPEAEARDATYWIKKGKPGMPAPAFKAATADAARYFDKSVSMELLKRAIRIDGEGPEQLVAIEGDLTMHEDTPRNAGGVVDLRYRNYVWPWNATLVVRFLSAVLTPGAVVALVDAGGAGGVGDWRPSSPKSKTGTYGCYRVVTNE